MTNPNEPIGSQTTYAAMREALEHTNNWIQKMCLEMKAHNFFPHMAELGLKYSEEANEALALPEPDPAQELLTSVQLERLKAEVQEFKRFASHKPGNEVSFFNYLSTRDGGKCANDLVWWHVAKVFEKSTGTTPNKADAEALVRILDKVDYLKISYRSEPCLYKEDVLAVVEAYEAATPLVKQIAGGG